MNVELIFLFNVLTLLITYALAKSIDHEEYMTQIAKSAECADDLKTLCNNKKHDMAILTCFQDSEEVMGKISDKCQHFLWDYKHKLTTSNLFDKIVKDQCSAELETIPQCKTASVGHRIPCLLDHKDQLRQNDCSNFLDEIGIIVFSDYHLIYRFVEQCSADIRKFKCGRITKLGSTVNHDQEEDNSEKSLSETGLSFADYVTSQAHTLDCLVDSIHDLSNDCKHQIMRLSELQSHDYHLNRGLYYACRDDREELCHDVKSGEGRVYKCLMRAKFSEKMSEECRKELTRKQQVESVDARANYPLIHACDKDIKDNHCMKDVVDISHEIVAMSLVIMCLHRSEINGKLLQPNCREEIAEKRKEMFEDLQLSPETLLACKTEVEQDCKVNIKDPGELFHCLLKLAEPDQHNKNGKLSKGCQDSVRYLLKVSNPTEDMMNVDSVVQEACASSYTALCQQHSNVKDAFQCLVDNINSPQLASRCREKISSFIYFMSLDITTDDKLNIACHHDAVRLCNGPITLEGAEKRTLLESNLEYHCMYEHYKKDRIMADLAEARGIQLSPKNFSLEAECSQEIFNLIKAQAAKIEFDPKIFIPCFDDIGRYCGGDESRGKEYECLQKNVKHLESKCREAIIEFSEMEDLDYRLNRLVHDACIPMVKQFCPHEKTEHILVCLEEHKFNPQMSQSCHAAIEHIQIMSLEEYHIDHRFASFCGPEIDEYCHDELLKGKDNQKNKGVSKASIVSCLSKTVIDKLLSGNTNPLSDECRRQFTFELLQRSESINLDPTLVEDCGNDIERLCKDMKPTEINSCLRENQNKLADKCHRRLFKRERLEALDADFDGELQQKCSQMIGEHCHNVPGRKMFQCLHRLMNEPGFDKRCRKLIISRLERRMNDIRLNPGLIKDCSNDIKKYCHVDNPNFDKPASGIEYEGKIILCLKVQFANDSTSLQENCRHRVIQIIVEANTNMRLDPTLKKGCIEEINIFCKKEMISDYDDPVNSVHNCLKHKFLVGELRSKDCKNEVKRLLREGRADVHVDLELFDACENTIMKLCRSERFGWGRKLACLLSLIDDQKASVMIEARCLAIIKDRREMWALVGDIESRSMSELYNHVTSSSTRVYLLSMLSLIVVALVLLGICCGRVSKRVMVDHKNK